MISVNALSRTPPRDNPCAICMIPKPLRDTVGLTEPEPNDLEPQVSILNIFKINAEKSPNPKA